MCVRVFVDECLLVFNRLGKLHINMQSHRSFVSNPQHALNLSGISFASISFWILCLIFFSFFHMVGTARTERCQIFCVPQRGKGKKGNFKWNHNFILWHVIKETISKSKWNIYCIKREDLSLPFWFLSFGFFLFSVATIRIYFIFFDYTGFSQLFDDFWWWIFLLLLLQFLLV